MYPNYDDLSELEVLMLVDQIRDLPERFAVVDTETCGKNPELDPIIEIGVVLVRDQVDVASRSYLVHTEQEIPAEVEALTGITNKILAVGPSVAYWDVDGWGDLEPPLDGLAALNAFDDMVQHSPVFAYGAEFDRTALWALVRAHRAPSSREPWIFSTRREWVCVCEIARAVLVDEDMPNFKLATVCERLGVVNARPHRALPDAYATWQVVQKLRELAHQKGMFS